MSETNVQLFPGVFRTTQGGSNPDFFLHSAGRVGIGNDAPGDVVPPGSSSGTFKLNVTGHANVSGTMQANKYYGDGSTLSGVTAVVGGYWDLDQANNNIKYDVGNVGIGGAAGTEELTVHGDLNLNGGNLKLNGQTAVFSNWTSGTNSIYRSVGNVGIGTTNADKAKLQINNTLALLNPSYKTPGDDDQLAGKIEFYLGGSAHELSTPVAGIEGYDKYAGGSFAGALALKVHGGEKMRILSNGNVGCGTSSPQQNLHVHESGSGQVVIAVTNDTTGGGNNDGIHFGIDSSEQGFVWHKQNTALLFATNNAERMRINNVGDVGIGGNPGTEKLKVHGDMTVQGQTRTSSPTVVKTWNAFNNNTSAGEYTFEARAITLAHFHYSSGEDVNLCESYLISCSDTGTPTVTILKNVGNLHLQVYSDRKVRFWVQGLTSNYNSSNYNLRISAIWKIS